MRDIEFIKNLRVGDPVFILRTGGFKGDTLCPAVVTKIHKLHIVVEIPEIEREEKYNKTNGMKIGDRGYCYWSYLQERNSKSEDEFEEQKAVEECHSLIYHISKFSNESQFRLFKLNKENRLDDLIKARHHLSIALETLKRLTQEQK
jgi:hypothetical protein